MRFKAIIIGALVLVIAIIAAVVVNYNYSIRNQGQQAELRVVQAYNNSVSNLSTCLDKGRVAAQVTQEEFDAVEDILVRTAAARYQDPSGKDMSTSAVRDGGQLFSAVMEDYPEIDQRSWQNLQTLVVGCRDEFHGTQKRLQDEVRKLETWIATDNVLNARLKSEFPSDTLSIEVAGETLSGEAALKHLSTPVVVADANTAFATGELQEQNLFD